MKGDHPERSRRKGRGFPPEEHQWKPGTSGNPRGRPRGSMNRKTLEGLTPNEHIALEEGRRTVATSDGPISVVRAVHRAQSVAAMKGGVMAQRSVIARIDKIEQKAAAAHLEALHGWEGYKRRAEEIRGNCSGDQFDRMNLLPHPDDVEVNFEAGTIHIYGPSTTYEKKVWDELMEAIAAMRQRILDLRKEIVKRPENMPLNLDLCWKSTLFLEWNEKLPPRYRLPRIPIWKNAPPVPW